jgi:hypothetical protein
MSYVYDPRKDEWSDRANLGWLLHHWSEVSYFEVHLKSARFISTAQRGAAGIQVELPPMDHPSHWDCWLIAYMTDSRIYATEFADKSVLKDWLARPRFEGYQVEWFGMQLVIPRRKKDW